MPVKGDGIDVDTLDAPDWLKACLKQLDTDGDGIDQEEIEEMLEVLQKMKIAEKNNSSDLDYTHFPPKVKEVMAQWDGDASGSVSVSELVVAAEAQKKMAQENKFMKQMLYFAVVVIFVLGAMSFAMGFAANEVAKDFRPAEKKSSRRRLYAVGGLGHVRVEKNGLLDAIASRILTEGAEDVLGADKEDQTYGEGQLVGNDGARMVTTQSGDALSGFSDTFDKLWEISPTDRSNVENMQMPGPGGSAQAFAKIKSVQATHSHHGPVQTIESDDGVKFHATKTPAGPKGHLEYPNGILYEVPMSLPRQLQAFDNVLDSACAFGDGCIASPPTLFVRSAAVDAPKNPISAPNPRTEDDFCVNDECDVTQYRQFSGEVKGMAPESAEDYFAYLDCDNNGKVDREERENGGLCFEEFQNHTRDHDPMVRGMADAGFPDYKIEEFRRQDKNRREQVNVDVLVDALTGRIPRGNARNGKKRGKGPFRDLKTRKARRAMKKKVRAADKEGRGFVSRETFTSALRSLRPDDRNLKRRDAPPRPPRGAKRTDRWIPEGKKTITNPREFALPEGAGPDDANQKFEQLDRDGNGRVTRQELVGGNSAKKKAFEDACLAKGDREPCEDGQLNAELFIADFKEQDAAGGELAEIQFIIKDRDGDGHIHMEEYTRSDANSMTDFLDASPGGRRLREVLVDRPRRRLEQKRMVRRERRLREKMQRRLGAAGDYQDWQHKRALRAQPSIERKQRRVRRLTAEIEERRQRRLETKGRELQAEWERENGRLLAASSENGAEDTQRELASHTPAPLPWQADLDAEALLITEVFDDFKTHTDFAGMHDDELQNYAEAAFELAEAGIALEDATAELKEALAYSNPCYTYSVARVLLDEDDLEWHNSYGTRNLIGHHIRNLQGECGTDGFPTDPVQNMKAKEVTHALVAKPSKLVKFKKEGLAKVKDTAHTDKMATCTGGHEMPFHKAMTDAKTLCEYESPLKLPNLQLRFLAREARILGATDEGSRRKLLERELLVGASQAADHCNTQVIGAKDLPKMQQSFGAEERDMKIKAEKLKGMHLHMAGALHRRLRRFLAKNPIHEEDMETLRRLQTEEGMYANDEEFFYTPSDFAYVFDEYAYTEAMTYPENKKAYEEGHIEYICQHDIWEADQHRADNGWPALTEPEMAGDLWVHGLMDSVVQDAAGNVGREVDTTNRITFAQFAAEKIWEIPECEMLPYMERDLPLNYTSGKFNWGDEWLWKNLFNNEIGPGCYESCGCWNSNEWDVTSYDHTCPWDAYFNCGCLHDKKHCHDALFRRWEEKGGANEECSLGQAGGAASRRLSKAQKKARSRKLVAKALRKNRIEKRRYRKLMPHDKKKVWDDIQTEKRRKRVLRAHYRKLIEKEVGSAPEKRHERVRMLQAYNWTDSFPTTDNFDPLAKVCGDDPSDHCPCTEAADEFCLGGFEPSYLEQTLEEQGMPPMHEVCQPSPNMANLAYEMTRRRLRKLEVQLHSSKDDEHRRNLQATHQVDIDSVYAAFADPYDFSLDLLTPDMQGEFLDMHLETSAPPDAIEEFVHLATQHHHPPDLWEVNQMIDEGAVCADIGRAQLYEPPWFDAVIDYASPGDIHKDVAPPPEDGLPMYAIDNFLTACGAPDQATNPEYCAAAEEIHHTMDLYCPPDMECPNVHQEDVEEMAFHPDFHNMEPAEKGITLGVYTCYQGLVHGVPKNESESEFAARSHANEGFVSVDEFTAPSEAEALKEREDGPQLPRKKKKNKKNKMRGKKKKNKRKKAKKTKKKMKDKMRSKIVQTDNNWSLRKLAELDEEFSGRRLSELSQDAQHGRRLSEIRGEFSRRRRLAELKGQEPNQYSMKNEFIAAQGLDELEFFYDGFTDWLAEAEDKKAEALEVLESGHVNYTDPEFDLLHHPKEDDLAYWEDTITEGTAALATLNTKITACHTDETTARGNNNYFADAYVPPTKTCTAGEATQLAKTFTKFMEAEEEPVHAADRVCMNDFIEDFAVQTPEAEFEDAVEVFYGIAATANEEPDNQGCVSEDAVMAPPPVFFPGPPAGALEAPEVVWDNDQILPLGRPGEWRRRNLFVTSAFKINWRRLAKDNVGFFDDDGTTKLAEGFAITNPDDARLMETGAMPWEVTVDEFVSPLKDTISDGAANMKKKKAQALTNIELGSKKAADPKKAMGKAAQADLKKGVGHLIDQVAGDCGAGDACDPLQSAASVKSAQIGQMLGEITGGAYVVPSLLDDAYDCDQFGESALSMFADTDFSGTPDGNAVQQLDFGEFCRQDKAHSHQRKVVDEFLETAVNKKAHGLGVTAVGAVLRERRRKLMERKLAEITGEDAEKMRRKLSEDPAFERDASFDISDTIHPALRRALKIPDAFLDHQGRRLQGYDLPEMEYETALTDTAWDAGVKTTLQDATVDHDDMMQLFSYENEFNPENMELFDAYHDTYDYGHDQAEYDFHYGDPALLANEIMDATELASVQPVIYALEAIVLDQPQTNVNATSPYVEKCGHVRFPSAGNTMGTYTAGNDWHKNGLAECLQHFQPPIGAHMEHKFQEVEFAEASFVDSFAKIAPGLGNATANAEIETKLGSTDRRCYDECAKQEVEGFWASTGGTGMIAECDQGSGYWDPNTGAEETVCGFLEKKGNPSRKHKAKVEAHSLNRRLAIERRRLDIKERRRLEEGENKLADCLTINGREFCSEGMSRKLQENADEMEAQGIRYLLPAPAQLGARKLRGNSRRHYRKQRRLSHKRRLRARQNRRGLRKRR